MGVALSPSCDLQCGLTPGEPLVSQTRSDCSSETGEPRHPVTVGPVSQSPAQSRASCSGHPFARAHSFLGSLVGLAEDTPFSGVAGLAMSLGAESYGLRPAVARPSQTLFVHVLPMRVTPNLTGERVHGSVTSLGRIVPYAGVRDLALTSSGVSCCKMNNAHNSLTRTFTLVFPGLGVHVSYICLS